MDVRYKKTRIQYPQPFGELESISRCSTVLFKRYEGYEIVTQLGADNDTCNLVEYCMCVAIIEWGQREQINMGLLPYTELTKDHVQDILNVH